MKKLLLISIFFTSIIVPIPTMARVDINAGISLPPPIVSETPQAVIVMPDKGGAYVVADADADRPQGGPIDRDEKQQNQPLEKEKTTGPEYKSDWRINVWPVERKDNVMSPYEREIKHTPPDR